MKKIKKQKIIKVKKKFFFILPNQKPNQMTRGEVVLMVRKTTD